MADLYINPRLTIGEDELRVSSARSGGPGGQNVNKVNSKITLKWSPGQCPNLHPAWRRRLEKRYGNRINRAGELVVQSDAHREQGRNLAEARQKLVDMLLNCQQAPKPRKATRPTRGSQRRRLQQKRQTAEKKRRRRPPGRDD